MMAGIHTVEGCSEHRNRTPPCIQTGAMGCCINPFGQSAQHRPTSTGEGTTELLSPAKAMGRCRSGSHNRHTTTLGQDLQKLVTAPMKKRQGWPGQIIQTCGPGLVGRQDHIVGNIQIRGGSAGPAVAINLIHEGIGPGKSEAQAIDGPNPEVIKADAMLKSHRLQDPHSGHADPWAPAPQPPPSPHVLSAFVLS